MNIQPLLVYECYNWQHINEKGHKGSLKPATLFEYSKAAVFQMICVGKTIEK
jgi:hypothetical protein